ncbi:hypothetical protein BGX31_010993 [Mortierella sp. GBA43]|nr:hypothetical protein BGX31_010993 [Mortierella sp. GBA43]
MLSSTVSHTAAPVAAFESDQLPLPDPFTIEPQATGQPDDEDGVAAEPVIIESGSLTGTSPVIVEPTPSDNESGSEHHAECAADDDGVLVDTNPENGTTVTVTSEPLQDDASTIYVEMTTTSTSAKAIPLSPTRHNGDHEPWPEHPRQFLERIKETLSRAELANLLSKGTDPFHLAVLRVHMESFDFKRDPIDLALRKFLLDFHFPKEAQQIDRVLEAFASRYHACNPHLFRSADVVYTIAFSLMLLHTDAHNKNVRHKMTKEQYVKQAKTIDGVNTIPGDILEVLFDNITFLKFVYAEDDMDVDGQRIAEVQPTHSSSWFSRRRNASNQRSDSYSMIRHGSIAHLAPDLSDLIPFRWPYYWKGTIEMVDNVQINNQFTRAPQVPIPGLRPRLHSQQPSGSGHGTHPSSVSMRPGARSEFAQHPDSEPRGQEYMRRDPSGQWNGKDGEEEADNFTQLKIVKCGILIRKIDIEQGRKSAVRGWRELGVILSGSQLLFFTDIGWFQQQRAAQVGFNPQAPPETDGYFSTDLSSGLPSTPQALISTLDSVAVVDSSYQKYHHVFRLACPNGKQYLLRADSEHEMNDWMSKINYASAFKSAGVRLRNYRVAWAPDVFWEKDELDRYQLRRHPPSSDAPLSPEPLDGRAQLIQAKLKEIDRQIGSCSASLAAELRLARGLEVLIPLQQSTRHKIVQSATVVGKRLRTLMLERTKLDCFRTILERDLSLVAVSGYQDDDQRPEPVSDIILTPADYGSGISLGSGILKSPLDTHGRDNSQSGESMEHTKEDYVLDSDKNSHSSGQSISTSRPPRPRRLGVPEFDRSASQDSLAEHCRICPVKNAEIPDGAMAIQAAIIDAARGHEKPHINHKSTRSIPDLNQFKAPRLTPLEQQPSLPGASLPPKPMTSGQSMLSPDIADAANRSRPRTLSTPGQRPNMMPRTVSIYSSSSQTATKLRRILEQGLRHFKVNTSNQSSPSSSTLASATSPTFPGSSLKTSFSANTEDGADASDTAATKD